MAAAALSLTEAIRAIPNCEVELSERILPSQVSFYIIYKKCLKVI